MPEYLSVDFADPKLDNYHELMAQIRRMGPAVRVREGNDLRWLLTRHEEVRHGLQDELNFPARAAYAIHTQPVQGEALQTLSPEVHAARRALVQPAFRAREVPTYVEPILEPVTERLVDAFLARGGGDLVADISKRLPFEVIARLLGVPPAKDGDFQRWAIALVSFRSDPEKALADAQDFTRYLTEIVEERRREPRDDFISLLATAEIDDVPLDDEAILGVIRNLFPAGADTTYLALGSLMYALLSHPTALERVRDDSAERPWAIEEALRWESPVAMMPRIAVRDCEVAGVHISRNQWVLLNIAAANRDPEVFSDPDVFDPGRRPRRALAFGVGTHFCLGAHLARRELSVALDVILERLPNLKLLDTESIRIVGTSLRGPDRLLASC
ncbi:cytochrome P450 [Myxococcota bacterium]|nr:cytochrome P450 [Myxococcota bacterium]